ncbi:MAG: phosphopantetheine-binding protein [Verrucomicrobiota bacterium]
MSHKLQTNLNQPSSMDRNEILQEIKEILKTVNTVNQDKVDGLTEDTDFITDLGAPSAEIVNIIAKAEDRFDVEFDDDDVDSLDSKVSATVDLIIKTQEDQG